MGFFSNIDLEAYDRQYSDRELAIGMAAYFKPHARRIALIASLLTVIGLSAAALPILVARGVDLLESDGSNTMIALLTLFLEE